jgi:glycosyltransferase involved in cell wall biosynthesis
MLSDVYFPRVNGVSTSIKTFHKELTGLGHEVTVVAPEYHRDDSRYPWLYRVPSRNIPFDPEDRMMKRKYVHALFETLQKDKYDIVHIQTPFIAHNVGIELARKSQIPVVETYHTHFEACLHHYLPVVPRPVTRLAARWFNRRQCNRVDGLIVPTRTIQDLLTSQGIHVPIEVIATGIDDFFFTQGDGARFRSTHNIEHERPVLVHIGRIAYEKNIDFLLHSLDVIRKTIPDILLILAGEGPAKNHLQALARTLRLENNILFVGYLDRATALLDCYSAGDVFIFSSKIETQGLVLLEAMAQGIPVVSVSSLGTGDILNAGKGSLIAEENTGDFSGKVVQLLLNPRLHARLSSEARDYARSWSAREFAVKKENFYRRIIDSYRLN